ITHRCPPSWRCLTQPAGPMTTCTASAGLPRCAREAAGGGASGSWRPRGLSENQPPPAALAAWGNAPPTGLGVDWLSMAPRWNGGSIRLDPSPWMPRVARSNLDVPWTALSVGNYPVGHRPILKETPLLIADVKALRVRPRDQRAPEGALPAPR